MIPAPHASQAAVRERWVCCQIGAREHYAVPRSLHRYMALDLLCTDSWVSPHNPLNMLTSRLRGRFHEELKAASIYSSTLGSLAFEGYARFHGLGGWPLIMARNKWFQHRVLSELRGRVGKETRTVMAYSYAALEVLKFARSVGWRTVLGQIDPGLAEEQIVNNLHDENKAIDANWERAPIKYWDLWRQECEIADRIVVNSNWSKQGLLQAGISEEKIRIIPLGYEYASDNSFQRSFPSTFDDTRPLRALFLGQINLRKGIAPLLRAVKQLHRAPIEFTFVGPIQIDVPSGIRNNNRVRWIGPVPRSDIGRFYQEADVFLFPTLSDGFGLTQLEAQAWKLPIITSQFCGEVIKHNVNGWVLTEVTGDTIASALHECIDNPGHLARLSSASVPSSRFALDRIGQEWLTVVD